MSRDWAAEMLGGVPIPLLEMEQRGLRSSGTIFIDDKQAAQTLQCAHCHTHWVVLRGSGRTRGWCNLCNAVTCGSKQCLAKHIPRGTKLDFLDGGELIKKGSENELAELRKDLERQFPGIGRIVGTGTF